MPPSPDNETNSPSSQSLSQSTSPSTTQRSPINNDNNPQTPSGRYFETAEDVFQTLHNLRVTTKNGTKTAIGGNVTIKYSFESHPSQNRIVVIPDAVGGLVTVSSPLEDSAPASLEIIYVDLEDFLSLSNGAKKPTGKDLFVSGRLKAKGKMKQFSRVGMIMDDARAARRSALTDDSATVEEVITTEKTGATGSKKKKSKKNKFFRGPSSFFKRSGILPHPNRSSMKNMITNGVISEFDERCLTDPPSLVSVQTLAREDEDDDSDKEDDSAYRKEELTRLEEEVRRLDQEAMALSSRCKRLEAQNIIASAQQLDIFARVFSFFLSASSLLLYWKALSWIFGSMLLPRILNHRDIVLPENVTGQTHLLWSVVTAAFRTMSHRFTVRAVQIMCAGLPYLHHKMYHGLAHRRFQVFVICFIIISRIKLVRWRVDAFVDKRETSDDTDDATSEEEPGTASTKPPARFGEEIDEDAIWEANYDINAHFLYVSILRLRGLWTKTAQYLSSRADFVPTAYVRELTRLQDDTTETPWEDIKATLSSAPGNLLEELIDVEEKPIASASIGQVHVARLRKTGEKVVLKVQHPHARTLLMDDFWSLKVLARIVTILEPEYGFFEILMNEWAQEARKELDFNQEMEHLKSAEASIQTMNPGNGNGAVHLHSGMTNINRSVPDPIPFRVEIPRPYEQLSSENVLVMSFCEGKRVDDMEQIRKCGVPPEAVMDAVAQAFAHMMYTSHIFNGDPHPGNIFIRPGMSADSKEGFTVVLLDWGLAKRLPEEKRVAFCQMTYAAATLDFGLILDAFKTMGLRMKREHVAEDMEGVRFLLRDMAPREASRKKIKAKMKTDMKRSKEKKRGQRVPMESKAYPGEFFFFVRTNELLHGLGSKLGVNMQYLDVLKPYAGRGLQSFHNLKHLPPDPISSAVISDDTLQDRIQIVLNDLRSHDTIAGAQVCVLDPDGQTLAHAVAGHMGSIKSDTPMRSDALILGFSVTKATAATLAHRMVQEGYLTLDEPICHRVWPAFCPTPDPPARVTQTVSDAKERWQWKRSVTLRHVLTHTAGLWSALPAGLTIQSLASCESCCAAFEYDPDDSRDVLLPIHPPGDKCTYHFMSFGWLVAGTLRGAYALRHAKGDRVVTYEEIYDAVLKPRLSQTLLRAGFRPCGAADEAHPKALTDASFDISGMIQLQREAEAMGEETEDIRPSGEEDSTSTFWKEIRETLRGKEFLLDPRIWNCERALGANVPAAGGRFTAKGLAHFYHELGSGNIIDADTLAVSTEAASTESQLQELQGQTLMSSSNLEEERATEFALGYQLIQFSTEANDAFGHAGIGGSIGFFHKNSGISVGIMLNKVGGDRDTAKKIVDVISGHFGW